MKIVKFSKCLTCKKLIDKHIFHPFCSKKCSEIDLGKWFLEKYKLFKEVDKIVWTPNLVIYNASARPKKGSIVELDPAETEKAINITCFGAFLVAREAAKRMIPKKNGSIFFTGATAGVKGFPNSSAFAMGKFGLRGLAQSLARELHPKGIHIAHFVIDGGIGKEPKGDYQTMKPDEIAKTYLQFYRQDKVEIMFRDIW